MTRLTPDSFIAFIVFSTGTKLGTTVCHAVGEREESRDGVAEGVEVGQDVEYYARFGFKSGYVGRYRLEVADEVAVRAADGLRQSRGAGGREDDRELVGLGAAFAPIPCGQRPFERRGGERYVAHEARFTRFFCAVLGQYDGVDVEHFYRVGEIYRAGARVERSDGAAETPAGEREREDERRVRQEQREALSFGEAGGAQLFRAVVRERGEARPAPPFALPPEAFFLVFAAPRGFDKVFEALIIEVGHYDQATYRC